MQTLTDLIKTVNDLPDADGSDSPRLREFVRRTSAELKLVKGVSAATTLEMIGYIRQLEEENRQLALESVQVAGKLRLQQGA